MEATILAYVCFRTQITLFGNSCYQETVLTSPSEESAQNLIKTLEKYLDLDRGSFSNVKVNGQEITFKVNPNVKGLNASEVAVKAGK
ncbi:hypothetical protein CDAR_26521 [Caerostris darwini]|uniref:Protein-tyrosine phosphatase receptor IA-2 ectodomain domain-containing protein n=1 Tax=Caerostris darwini TaxID=1538125 RepID=A0AAV4QEX7_9ARAC|nr:hypothetical protein CDAR_26521 [Caerostris darwini]